MVDLPPQSSKPGARRHRSHQRDLILEWLRDTDTHPTAAQIHEALLPGMPSLSLGTVYRNLEVLLASRLVEEVTCSGGPARYDANLTPHHHFTCDFCRAIVDVNVPTPRSLAKRLESAAGLSARRVEISFFGLCADCEREAVSSSAGSAATRATGS